jgi:hypothetical protein
MNKLEALFAHGQGHLAAQMEQDGALKERVSPSRVGAMAKAGLAAVAFMAMVSGSPDADAQVPPNALPAMTALGMAAGGGIGYASGGSGGKRTARTIAGMGVGGMVGYVAGDMINRANAQAMPPAQVQMQPPPAYRAPAAQAYAPPAPPAGQVLVVTPESVGLNGLLAASLREQNIGLVAPGRMPLDSNPELLRRLDNLAAALGDRANQYRGASNEWLNAQTLGGVAGESARTQAAQGLSASKGQFAVAVVDYGRARNALAAQGYDTVPIDAKVAEMANNIAPPVPVKYTMPQQNYGYNQGYAMR